MTSEAKPENREIFTYNNGQRNINCDPLIVEMSWQKACESVDIDTIFKKLHGPDFFKPISDEDQRPKFMELPQTPELEKSIKNALIRQNEATLELISVICRTFNLKPNIGPDPYPLQDVKWPEIDEENGLSLADILDVHTSWQNFVMGVKKNIDSNVSLPPHMDQSSPPTTKPASDGTTTWESPKESEPSRLLKVSGLRSPVSHPQTLPKP